MDFPYPNASIRRSKKIPVHAERVTFELAVNLRLIDFGQGPHATGIKGWPNKGLPISRMMRSMFYVGCQEMEQFSIARVALRSCFIRAQIPTEGRILRRLLASTSIVGSIYRFARTFSEPVFKILKELFPIQRNAEYERFNCKMIALAYLTYELLCGIGARFQVDRQPRFREQLISFRGIFWGNHRTRRPASEVSV